MKERERFTMVALGMFALCLFAFPMMVLAAELHVGGDQTYSTISDAVAAANPGDVIIVHEGTYTENVDVTKSLTIKSESGYEYTTVEASNTDDHVFEVQANNVTIGGEGCGFSIYGATDGGMAGIFLSGRTGCTIQGNRCGWDSGHYNDYGIYLISSSANTLTGNTCNSNSSDGIYLVSSSTNTLTGNTCNSNSYYGILLSSSSNNNTLTGNTCNLNDSEGICLNSSSNNTISGNTCGNSYHGISVYDSSNSNTLSGNTCDSNSYDGICLNSSSDNTISGNICNSNNEIGIYLAGSSNNTLTGNTCNSNINYDIYLFSSSNNTISGNTCGENSESGIYLYNSSYNTLTGNTANENSNYGICLSSSNNNTIYLNNLSNNTGGNACVTSSSGNIWHSPTMIYYDYTSGSFHKNYLGNYYGNYTGSDEDGDGIGTDPYNGTGMADSYPLMDTSACYSLQAWWLNGDSKMYRDDRTKTLGSITINGGSSNIWIADQATLMNIEFSGSDTWTGQIVFTSALGDGETFAVEIGSSTDGSDFTAGGPDATITGDGSKTVFTFETDASAFIVAKGSYLALKITNNSSSNYAVQTGGASSYCSAPNESQDYSLPVELASFNATAGNGNITLKWITESEIENLGFNIYRSTNENGEFVMLNAELIAGAGSSSEKHEYSYVDQDVKNGITYWYKLEDIDYNGKTELHGPISATVLGPKEFCLHSNYPNPFNPVTTISYDLAEDVYVELTVYNIIGEKVTTLVKGNQPAGYYNIEWDGRNSRGLIVSSGMYLLRINAGNYCKTNKMVFVR